MCRAGWGGPGVLIYIRAYDHFSAAHPTWLDPVTLALDNWSIAHGPQVFNWGSGATENHYYASTTGSNGLTSGSTGITWLCPTGGGACTIMIYPMPPQAQKC